MTELSRPNYRPDIDGLRAVAVLSVVAFHAFPSSISGGFIGVDVFFVISGFLITTILLENMERGTFTFSEFYGRRIARIFPALLVVIVGCLAFGWFALMPDEFRQLGKHALGGAAFVANFVLLEERGYFDTAAVTKPFLHLWSLGVEEQFYIVWPLMLWAAYKVKLNAIALIIAVGSVSMALNLASVREDAVMAFYAPQTRFWELLIGSAIAYHRVAPQSLAWLGAALLGAGFLLINKTSGFPGLWALLPTVGAALIIMSGRDAWINRRILSHPVLVWFGLISFPLYLWHWPLLSFLHITHHGAMPSRELRIAAILLSILLAWLTYRFVERPIRFRGIPFRGMALSASMVVTGFIGFAVFSANGVPSRINITPTQAHTLFEPYPYPQRNENCTKVYPEFRGAWSCLLSKPSPAEVAIIGDSHAHQYYLSLAAALPVSVLNISAPACLPFSSDSLETQTCREATEKTLKLLESPSIKTVYLTGYFSFLAAGGMKSHNFEGMREARPLSEADARSFQANAEAALRKLAHKDVVVLMDIPDLIFRPVECVRFGEGFIKSIRGHDDPARSPERCGIDAKEYAQRISIYDETLKGVLAKFNVRIYDPRPLFCNDTFCSAIKEGVPLYFNSDHLTRAGADYVIRELIRNAPPNHFSEHHH